MGYYSEVVIIIPKDNEKEILAKSLELEKMYSNSEELEKLNKVNKSFFELADSRKEKTSADFGTQEVVYIWDYVKWYDFSPWISSVMKTLNWLKENDISYSYARIGEEIGDIEIEHNCGEENETSYIEVSLNY